jgi:creatinine deaminase
MNSPEARDFAVPDRKEAYRAAVNEAMSGLEAGGIPIGSALLVGDVLVASGSNKRVQENSPILHAEIDCLRKAGRPRSTWTGQRILFTTLSPCLMCAGASLNYAIDEIVIGENRNFEQSERILRDFGVKVTVLDDEEMALLFGGWIASHPELWNEDIGR